MVVGRQEAFAILLIGKFVVLLATILALRFDERQELRRLGSLCLLHFSFEFLSLFFFNLLHSLQEKLLNITSLVEYHLTHSP